MYDLGKMNKGLRFSLRRHCNFRLFLMMVNKVFRKLKAKRKMRVGTENVQFRFLKWTLCQGH